MQQKCNGRKSRLSKLLSIIQKQLQEYNIRDIFASKEGFHELDIKKALLRNCPFRKWECLH